MTWNPPLAVKPSAACPPRRHDPQAAFPELVRRAAGAAFPFLILLALTAAWVPASFETSPRLRADFETSPRPRIGLDALPRLSAGLDPSAALARPDGGLFENRIGGQKFADKHLRPPGADLSETSRWAYPPGRFYFTPVTGYEFDPETGLYYAKARFYDPEVGRFSSEDPFQGKTEEPPSLHKYYYAFENPLSYIDSKGLDPEIPLFKACGVSEEDAFFKYYPAYNQNDLEALNAIDQLIDVQGSQRIYRRTWGNIIQQHPELFFLMGQGLSLPDVAKSLGIKESATKYMFTAEYGDVLKIPRGILSADGINKVNDYLEWEKQSNVARISKYTPPKYTEKQRILFSTAERLESDSYLVFSVYKYSLLIGGTFGVGSALGWGVATQNFLLGSGIETSRESMLAIRDMNHGSSFEAAFSRNFHPTQIVEAGLASSTLGGFSRGISENIPKPPSSLELQRGLAELTTQTREAFVKDPNLLLRYLRPREVDAIVEHPWCMRPFFGTAVERRVAEIAARDESLSVLRHTTQNAPQDFIAPNGVGFDITGGSMSSILSHFNRSEVDAVITYESIPNSFGHSWVRWLLNE